MENECMSEVGAASLATAAQLPASLPDFEVADPPGAPTNAPGRVLDAPVVTIRPWTDPVIDVIGFDPRSRYVERFWLGILGPSTTWLLRHVAAGLDQQPDGFELPLALTARELGLGDRSGRHSPFMRALWRCHQFEMARFEGDCFMVRRRLPPLNRRQLQRLPESVQQAHRAWQEERLGVAPAEADRRRARALAITLLEIDPDASAVETRLTAWGVHPAAAGEATEWAWRRHTVAAAAAVTGE
jgi:hypothetical protein